MDYRFFSDIFRALTVAEDVAVICKDECLLAQVRQAKASALAQFDRSFPSTVEEVVKCQGFSCKPFFETIAEYPFLLEGREKKFLNFVASVAHYARNRKSNGIALDYNVVRIMVSPYIDDFVWKQVVNDCDNGYFVRSVEAVWPLVCQNKKKRSSFILTEELLPSWLLAFPEITLGKETKR